MKFKSAIIFTIIALACVMFSFGGNPSFGSQAEQDQEQGRVAKDEADTADTKVVDYEADKIYKARGDSAIRLVGNVIFHHNGAIIQCDSAYRYDEKRMDCFGKVIINQDSTYIYGDMATYDGNINLAHVYAPLIKLVHGDAVLYTYNLKYNTKTSIADYERGGIMSQNNNFMESESGVYNGDNSTIKFLNQVEMRNDTYLIRTDSASFNMNTEVVTFLATTYIWDSERDFLMADRGGYDTKSHVYLFTQNAYAMTPDQEMWADSMEYHSNTKEAFMQRNIQILDTTQQVLAFGDWGYYNDSLKNAILTRTPSMMAYETKGDTAYMRADSIFFYTFKPGMSHYEPGDQEQTDTTGVGKAPRVQDSLSMADSLSVADSLANVRGLGRDSLGGDSLTVADSLRLSSGVGGDSLAMDSTFRVDSLSMTTDSLKLDSLITDSLQADSLTNNKIDKLSKKNKTDKRRKKAKDRALANQADGSAIDPDKVIASADKIDKIEVPSKKKKRDRKSKNKGSIVQPSDSLSIVDSLSLSDSTMIALADSLAVDSLSGKGALGDSLALDSLSSVDSLSMASPASEKDSMERVVRAYRNVKIFRSDFQAVADSVVGFSVDSVMNMYGRPILWAEQSQVTADQIDAYAKDEKLDWADFIGSPFITQEVDTSMYNQASGKEMRAFFLNNEMDYAELEGTVMNYYYMEDEDSLVVAFAVINCAMLTMYFENQEPAKMNWSGQPEWIIYPIEDIPSTQPQRLEGYTWSPQLRPANKEEITTRTVLPSIRVECLTYDKPTFKIEQRINSYKKQILEEGIWRDRTDLPLVTADYFTNRVLDY